MHDVAFSSYLIKGENGMEEMLQVGIISSTHGLKGEVKVYPTTDDMMRFKKLSHVILDTGTTQLSLEVQHVKFFKQFVILKFQGIDHIEEIESYKGKRLLVKREDAVALEKDEYFVADMIGMRVYLDDQSEFGILKDIMETGANDVYVVESKEHGEVLIPAIKECILSVDVEKQHIVIHLMDGLL